MPEIENNDIPPALDTAGERPYPQLLSADEERDLLTQAEQLWADLQANNIGGFSDGNRPFHIVWAFKTVIEKFGNRDVGLKWSKDQLDVHPDSTAL